MENKEKITWKVIPALFMVLIAVGMQEIGRWLRDAAEKVEEKADKFYNKK